jgi:hypothetical protein
VGGVVEVVGHLLDRLARDPGERGVRAGAQRGVQLGLPGGEDQQARHRDAKIGLGPLDQPDVAEVALVAEVRQVVLAAAVALDRTGMGEQGAGLTELVEADVGERQVLLELRGAADPPAQPLGGDQGVVAESEDVVDVCGGDAVLPVSSQFDRILTAGGHLTSAAVSRFAHRCSTPSGTS